MGIKRKLVSKEEKARQEALEKNSVEFLELQHKYMEEVVEVSKMYEMGGIPVGSAVLKVYLARKEYELQKKKLEA